VDPAVWSEIVSAGFPYENLYAPGDAGIGQPVRFPMDAPIYTTPQQAARFPRTSTMPAIFSNNMAMGAALIALIVLLHEHRRIRGRWIPRF
jgi:hypothetical protein